MNKPLAFNIQLQYIIISVLIFDILFNKVLSYIERTFDMMPMLNIHINARCLKQNYFVHRIKKIVV